MDNHITSGASGQGEVGGCALGTIAKYSSVWWANVAKRLRLQRAARDLVVAAAERGYFDQVQRVCYCLWSRVADQVRVIHHAAEGTASYGGLATCGSVWMCPVCAAKISERRRKDLATGLEKWEADGGLVLMATYTLRHQKGDDLALMVQGLAAARKTMTSGWWVQQHKKRWGLVGSVRSLEVTCGAAGWHVHMHELVLMARPAWWDEMDGDDRDIYVKAFRDELLAKWGVAVVAAGLRDVNEHGVKVDTRSSSIAEYVTKLGSERTWTIEHELTKAVSKSGRNGGRSPIALLADAADGDDQAGRLWLEYARVFKGKRQLVWSKGLRSCLGLAAEKTDDELAADQDAWGFDLVHLAGKDWDRARSDNAAFRWELLQVAATGDREAVVAFLAGCGVFVCEVSPAEDAAVAELVNLVVSQSDYATPQLEDIDRLFRLEHWRLYVQVTAGVA